MFARLRLRRFTLLVLAWFVVALGVATAAPAVNPQQIEWVCSASGDGQWVVHDGGGAPATKVHAAECALCVTVAPPPAQVPVARIAAPTSRGAFAWRDDPPPGPRAAAPLPPRGPPAIS